MQICIRRKNTFQDKGWIVERCIIAVLYLKNIFKILIKKEHIVIYYHKINIFCLQNMYLIFLNIV